MGYDDVILWQELVEFLANGAVVGPSGFPVFVELICSEYQWFTVWFFDYCAKDDAKVCVKRASFYVEAAGSNHSGLLLGAVVLLE